MFLCISTWTASSHKLQLCHAAGDGVLCRVASTLLDGIRDTDYVGRLGGEEFALLSTRTSWENGISLAECVEINLNNFMVDWCDRKIAVSASLGLQKYGAKDEGVDLTAGPMKPCIKLSA